MQRSASSVQQSKRETRRTTYQERLAWAAPHSNYARMEDFEIEQENRRILVSLRELNQEVTMEVAKCMQRAANSPPRDPSAELSLLQEHSKNNAKLIETLNRTLKTVQQRKEQLLKGREQQTTDERYRIMDEISTGRAELRQLKLQIKELEKDLVQNQQRDVPYCREVVEKLEEELRVCSSKYTNYLKRFHISEDQLLSVVPAPPVYLSTGALDTLEKREAEQYKEYLNIVKLSEILSHRNESDLSKYSREYGLKLKQLETIMAKLTEQDGQLASRELELLETKKQVELMKLKVGENAPSKPAPFEDMRRNSQSVKNIVHYEERIAEIDEIADISRRSTNKISSTQRYIKRRAFPLRKKSSQVGQNYFQLDPIKAKLGRAGNATQQTH